MLLVKYFCLIFQIFIILNATIYNLNAMDNQEKYYDLFETVIYVLETCFREHINTIIQTEEFNIPITQLLIEKEYLSVIQVDEKLEKIDRPNANPNLATFISEANDNIKLNKTLLTLRSSPWWDTESRFILIGTRNNSCVDASKMLQTAWTKKLLSVVYFCYNGDNNNIVTLYTFNPFTNYALDPWQKVDNNDTTDERWTMYKQPFIQDPEICRNLMFDKTKRLDGYKVRPYTSWIKEPLLPRKIPYSLDVFSQLADEYRAFIFTHLFSYMNVTLEIDEYIIPPLVTPDGVWYGSTKELHDGKWDLNLLHRKYDFPYKYQTYPLGESYTILITQKRPLLRAEEKIIAFLDPYFVLIALVVIAISIIILKINRNQDSSAALLELIRLFLGTGILQPLNNLPIRIYFFGILWLALIVNGIFQGNLAVFLTKPDRYTIETIEQAIALQNKIYFPKLALTYSCFTSLSPLQSRSLYPIDEYNCAPHVINDSHAACAIMASEIARFAFYSKLHISAPIIVAYPVYWTSADYPLRNKFNIAASHCVQSGIIHRATENSFWNYRKKTLAFEAIEAEARYRPIIVDDITFIFKILFTGYLLAFLVFLMELRRFRLLNNNP